MSVGMNLHNDRLRGGSTQLDSNTSNTSKVVVGFLGPFSLAGATRSLGPGNPQHVLALLASRQGARLSREMLIDELYGEDAPASADSAMRTYLSAVGRLHAGGESVIREGEVYSLNGAVVTVDVYQFEARFESAQQASLAGHPAVAETLLQEALLLWRGDSYTGLRPLPRLLAASEVLGRKRAQAEDDLGETRLQLGMHLRDIVRLEEAAEARPTRERRWFQLMLGLYRCGRQREALLAFDRARKHLGDVGLAPGSAIRDLQAAIYAQSPRLLEIPLPNQAVGLEDRAISQSQASPRGNVPTVRSNPTGAESRLSWALSGVAEAGAYPLASGLRTLAERCVGRQAMVAKLIEAGSHVVVGSAGSGKSTLVANAAVTAVAAGFDALFFSCEASATNLGLEPSVDTIRAAMFAAGSAGHRLLVIVDDVHLRPQLGREIATLAFSSRASGISVVATMRATSDVDAMLVPGSQCHELQPLCRSDVEELIANRRPDVTEPALSGTVDRVLAVSGGWPLLVELALAMPAAPIVTSTTQLTSPAALVRRVLDSLTEPAAQIVTMAAFIGGMNDSGVLAELCGVSISLVEAACDAAIEMNLLDGDSFAFRHPAIVESIIGSLSPTKRRRTATAVVQCVAIPGLVRARMVLLAGGSAQAEVARDLLSIARQSSRASFRFHEVVELVDLQLRFERSLETSDELGTPNDVVVELLLELADALDRTGETLRGSVVRQEVLSVAERAGRADWAVRAVGDQPAAGRSIVSRDRISMISRAIALCGLGHRPAEELHLRAERVVLRALAGETGGFRSDLERLEKALGGPGSQNERARILRAIIYARLGDPTVSERAEQTIELFDLVKNGDGSDQSLLSDAYTLRVRSFLEQGRVSDARAVVVEFEQRSLDADRPIDLWATYVSSAAIGAMMGEAASAASFAGEAAALGRRFDIGDSEMTAFVHRYMCDVMFGVDLAEPLGVPRIHQIPLTTLTIQQDDESLSRYALRLTLCAAELSRSAVITRTGRNDAAELFRRAAEVFDPLSGDVFAISGCAWITEAAWQLGHLVPEAVIASLRAWSSDYIVGGVNPAPVLGPADRYLGLAEVLHGNVERGLSILVNAARRVRDQGGVGWAEVLDGDVKNVRNRFL